MYWKSPNYLGHSSWPRAQGLLKKIFDILEFDDTLQSVLKSTLLLIADLRPP